MKRFAAALLSCALLFITLSDTAYAAVMLPYTYAPVQIVLGSKSALDEMEFRQWAYEKLGAYKQEYLTRENKSFEWYDEYHKLAVYKTWFDNAFGKETNVFGNVVRSIEYTSKTMTEEQLDEMYLKVMLDSLREMKAIDPDFIEKYYELSDEKRKTYTLTINESGEWEWTQNDMLAATDEKAKADFISEWGTLISDTVDLCVSTYVTTKAPTNDDLIESIADVATEAIKEISKTVSDNMKAEAENLTKRYLANNLVQTLDKVRIADIACLETLYLSEDNKDERTRRVAQKIVDYYRSDEMQERIKDKAKGIAEAETQAALDELGMELQGTLEGSEVVIVAVMDIIRLTITEAVEYAQKQFDESLKKGDDDKKNNNSKQDDKKEGDKKKEDKKNLDFQTESMFRKLWVDVIPECVEMVCDNVEEEWIKTGEFSISYFTTGFEKKDFAELWEELNIFDLITDYMPIDDIVKLLKGNHDLKGNTSKLALLIDNYGTTLEERLLCVLIYYGLETFETIADEHIKNVTATEEESKFLKELGNHALDLIKDMLEVTKDYVTERNSAAIEGIANDRKKKLDELKASKNSKTPKNESYSKDAGAINREAQGLIDILNAEINEIKEKYEIFEALDKVSELADKAWDVGEGIVDTTFATLDHLSGEDGMSLLAQETVTARELSLPLALDIRGSAWYDVMDPKTPLDEVWNLVAKMQRAIDYDAAGAEAYYEVDVQGNDQRKNTDFIKIINGGSVFRHNIVNLELEWIDYPYTNVYGSTGLVSVDNAQFILNNIIEWQNKLNEGWKDEWLLLPGVGTEQIKDLIK